MGSQHPCPAGFTGPTGPAVQPGSDLLTTAPQGQNVKNHLKVLHDTDVSDFKETDIWIDCVRW